MLTKDELKNYYKEYINDQLEANYNTLSFDDFCSLWDNPPPTEEDLRWAYDVARKKGFTQ